MTEVETDTHKDSPPSEGAELMPVQPYLFLVLECDRLTAGGARFSLRGIDEVVIGRGPERRTARPVSGGVRRLVVHVPGKSMSSTHARIRCENGGWLLEDAQSTNGSNVNGSCVVRAVLRDGDVLELGHTLFVFRAAVPTPAGTPLDLDSADLRLPLGFATLMPEERPRLEGLARIANDASAGLPILLQGETGTGKEVLARSIHHISGRAGRYVAVNCGALPSTLVESNLFGHVRGAFSGAFRDELGAIRTAHGGTLLLDEIGDLALAAQPSLLRFLQEREVTPVGSAQAHNVDVRVIAATHQPLDQMVARGTFRADLLARLSAFTHSLRPLRARREDLGVVTAALLVQDGTAFADAALSPQAGRQLLSADWPWNIRQLGQVLRRGFALAQGRVLSAKQVMDALRSDVRQQENGRPSQPPRSLSEEDALLQKELLMQLDRHAGNVTAVAKALGKERMQIHRWMKRFDIEPDAFRGREKRDDE
jgi:transcriptional regulator with AAA-type ATPase domain